jgi:hypothetical protein
MILLSQLIGQQAISLTTAEKSGKVKGIVLKGNRVAAVQIDDVTIPADAVRSFEGDVLTYDSAVETTERAGINPIGRLVLDHLGDGIGAIRDLQIGADGTVEMVLLDSGDQLNGARLEAVGNFAAIVGSDFPPPTGVPAA